MPPREHLPDPRPHPRPNQVRELAPSPVVRDLSEWCAGASRLLQLARRYGADGAEALALRLRLIADLVVHVEDHAPCELVITPRSIVMGGSPVLVVDSSNVPTGDGALERELPWILHRDGVRTLKFERGLTETEAATWLDILLTAAPASATDEDVVTMVWDAGFEHLRLGTEESLVVRSNPLLVAREEKSPPHVNDWRTPDAPATDCKWLWEEALREEAASPTRFEEAWIEERQVPFVTAAETFAMEVLVEDPRSEMAEAFAASVVTWVATAVQRCDWIEAMRAHEVLLRTDPTGHYGTEPLAYAFGSVDAEAVAERLDEADTREQARLFAFVVRAGAPALPLLVKVLGGSNKARVRAGATTALAYAFADDPAPLGAWLADPRWHVVRNIVFVLGQIGGAEVVPLLAVATRHLDQRVRRAAVLALGQVPTALRRSMLTAQLDTNDGRLLASALSVLGCEPDPSNTAAILARVRAADFEARPDEHKVALLAALGDTGDNVVVPALEEVLVRGGWFARRSPERTAAARALARLSSPMARTVLEQGLRNRSDAVREACDEALAHGGRP